MEIRPCYPLHTIHMFTEFTHTHATLPRHSNIAPAILFVLGMVALHESFQRTIDDRFVPKQHSCDGTQLQQFASNHEAQTFSRVFYVCNVTFGRLKRNHLHAKRQNLTVL